MRDSKYSNYSTNCVSFVSFIYDCMQWLLVSGCNAENVGYNGRYSLVEGEKVNGMPLFKKEAKGQFKEKMMWWHPWWGEAAEMLRAHPTRKDGCAGWERSFAMRPVQANVPRPL